MKNNLFDTKTGVTGLLSYNNVDAKFISNRFTGTGVAGIYVDGNSATNQYRENIQILGNKFVATSYDMANVVLTENTRNCKVVGSDLKDNVVDNGLNNKVINTTKMPGPQHGKELQHKNPYSVLKLNRGLSEKP
jgi:hypothetical protein